MKTYKKLAEDKDNEELVKLIEEHIAPIKEELNKLRIYVLEEEKLNIAQKYLLPKQVKENGLEEGFVTVEAQAMRDIINYYTREAGVRTLERTIGKVCRKIAKKFVENPSLEGVVVTSKDLEEYLGRYKYLYDLWKDLIL